jgi:Spy/CpxP family protein refolding chaperone
VTPNISHAQFPPQSTANNPMKGGIENIPGMNFTNEQKQKLQKLKAEVNVRMNKALTSKQQEYVKSAMQAGRNPQEVMRTLNLSRQQKEQIEGVQTWQRNQMLSILTNEQKQKLMNMMKKQGGARPF